VTRMFRFRFLLIFVALFSLTAVTGETLAHLVGHCDARCTSQNDMPGQDQQGGACDCVCHHGLVATLSSARMEFASAPFVCVIAEEVQHVEEAPLCSIDLPPQLV
jgi:hypothetical protein